MPIKLKPLEKSYTIFCLFFRPVNVALALAFFMYFFSKKTVLYSYVLSDVSFDICHKNIYVAYVLLFKIYIIKFIYTLLLTFTHSLI